MKDHSLFFFAIPLPEDIREEIQIITEEISLKYDTKKALSSEPHITIIPPFWYPGTKVDTLKNVISHVSKFIWEFPILLNGYDTFPRNVLFIHVVPSDELQSCHDQTYNCLPQDLYYKVKRYPEYNPHITIAFKDISAESFAEAKKEYLTKEYLRAFSFNGLALYQHNGKTWDRK
ncbi:MAG: 2'-5' RNA ligase family protein [Saprospiraceae bacterium]|nr:2'-5' RNA ligase family protein [Saprospiraceae bacterium]